MDRHYWWLPLAVVTAIGMGSMIFIGVKTYDDAPPVVTPANSPPLMIG